MSWVAVAVGATVGAGLGAIAGSAKGGDAVWKGALTGSVAGAVGAGVGGLAGPAGLGLSGMAAGALGGGAAGLAGGAMGTALNGGNGNDYLRNMFTSGATGAALGAAGGAAFGPSAAGEAGAITPPAGESGLAQGGTGLETGGVQGMTTEATSPGVQQSITGPTSASTQGTTPQLSDVVSNNQYAAANNGTMTDIGGSSSIPQELPGSYTAPENSFSTPATSDQFQGWAQSGAQNAQRGMDAFGLDGTSMAEGSTIPATPNTSMAPSTQVGNESPTSLWDDMNKWWNKSSSKSGKNMWDAYLKSEMVGGAMRGLGGLVGAGEAKANRQQLMDLYNQQNERNQFYANQLQQTYQNPQAYLGSPEAQAIRSAALQKGLAYNAEAGRRTQGAALSNLLMQEQMKNLDAYRRGMPRPDYGTAAQNLVYAQRQSPLSNVTGGLANIFGPAAAYYTLS